MNKQRRKGNRNRGDASIVFTFVVLMIVLMSAFTISVISVSTMKGARTGENSALALYAADTGMEKGTFEYWWWKTGDPGTACDSNNTSGTTVDSTTYSLTVDNQGNGGITGSCPSASGVGNTLERLCIEAIGRSGGADSTERKLTSQGGDLSSICNFQ